MISHLSQLVRPRETGAVSRTDAQEALSRGQEKVSQLSDGQTVQGKVLSVAQDADGGRTAQVDLGDGAVVNARVSGTMNLSVGQEVSFAVRGQAGQGGVTFRPLYANTSADLAGLKALSQAGLPAAPDMTAMVREMMSEGMPIDRASLLNMTRGVLANPGHATTVVQMTQLGIPVTPENIEQFENYKNYEHQVVETMDAIMDELPEAFREMSAAGNRQGALDLYGELLQLFGGGEAAGETAAAPGGAPGAQAVFTEELLGEAGAPGEETAGASPGAVRSGEEAAGASTEAGAKALQNGGVPETEDAGAAFLKALREQTGRPADPGSPEDPGAPAQAAKGQPAGGPAAASAASPAAQQFTELLRALEIPEATILRAQTSGADNSAQTELLRALSDAWQKSGHRDAGTDKLWSKLFSSREMGEMLKEAVSRDWLLGPRDVEKKENVQKLYDRLQEQTRKLAQVLADTHGTATKLSESVRGLQNNLNFMNDLNHMFQYVQLPLKMSGQNTHGDFYVYANRKKGVSEDGSVSALLHLDMEHMGPVDVHVRMRDNHVNTNFYLADDEMIDFLMEHIGTLDERLKKRGYSMEARLHRQDEEALEEDAPVREMLGGNLGHMSVLSHTAFDALA